MFMLKGGLGVLVEDAAVVVALIKLIAVELVDMVVARMEGPDGDDGEAVAVSEFGSKARLLVYMSERAVGE